VGTREHPHGDYEGRTGSTEQLGGSVDRGQVSTRKVARHRATEIGSREGGERGCVERIRLRAEWGCRESRGGQSSVTRTTRCVNTISDGYVSSS